MTSKLLFCISCYWLLWGGTECSYNVVYMRLHVFYVAAEGVLVTCLQVKETFLNEGRETELWFKIQDCLGQSTRSKLETCFYHAEASVSDGCLCHGADQHMLLMAEVCVHRNSVCARLVGVLQVDDYTSPPWLTTRFLCGVTAILPHIDD